MKKVRIVFIGMTSALLALILMLIFVDPSNGQQSVYDSGIIALLFKFVYPTASFSVQNAVPIIGIFTCVFAGYLLGSINFALIISKNIHNQDIRRFGSKNAGMTNMLRVYGKKSGLLTLLGDALKTAVPILLGRLLCGETGAYLAALFAILGHTMPVYYKFKGGKGVVSSAIAILLLDWQVGVVVIGVFAIVLIISRFVSLSSIIAAFAYPGIIFIFNNVRFKGEALPDAAAMMFAFFVGIYVIFLHRTNIARIYNREENKLDFKKLFKRKKPIENAEDTPEE